MISRWLIACVVLFSGLAVAEPASQEADLATVYAAVSRLAPGLQRSDVSPSPVSGLYEVVIGLDIIYVSADGKYIIPKVVGLRSREDISESKQAGLRKAYLDKMNEDDMIVFSPKNPRHTVTVFTDIDCGYCRKLHAQVDKYMDKGIKVRYLFFPRSGPDTPSYYKAVSVWCSEDRKKAMTEAKAGVSLPRKDCPNPIKDQMLAGDTLGVRGTPMIVLDNGRIIRGYLSPNQLAQALEQPLASR